MGNFTHKPPCATDKVTKDDGCQDRSSDHRDSIQPALHRPVSWGGSTTADRARWRRQVNLLLCRYGKKSPIPAQKGRHEAIL